MKKAIIRVEYDNQTFRTEFSIEKDTPEYVVADEAYRVALLFAETRVLATTGHPLTGYEVGEVLQKINYSYNIEEDEQK